MSIQTLNSKNVWVDCEHECLAELLKGGWQPLEVKDEHVLMKRNGYINLFREVENKITPHNRTQDYTTPLNSGTESPLRLVPSDFGVVICPYCNSKNVSVTRKESNIYEYKCRDCKKTGDSRSDVE